MIVRFLKYVSYYSDYRTYVQKNPECDSKELMLSWIFIVNSLLCVLIGAILGAGFSLYVVYGIEASFMKLFMTITPYLVALMFIGIHLITLFCELLLLLIKKFSKNGTY